MPAFQIRTSKSKTSNEEKRNLPPPFRHVHEADDGELLILGPNIAGRTTLITISAS